MNSRLLGQETEYAIRFSPADGSEHPGNAVIFGALRAAISSLVKTKPGYRAELNHQFFIENGGSFYYEFLPDAYRGGLIEGATPECRGPGELLLYQRAQESLLIRALPLARSELEESGFPGELGLIKNCRDAEGHTYGAQENYEAEIACGWSRFLLNATTAVSQVLLLPVILLSLVVAIAILLPVFLVVGVLHGLFTGWLARPVVEDMPAWEKWVRRWDRRLFDFNGEHPSQELAVWFEYRFCFPFTFLAMIPQNLAYCFFMFRREIRALEALLVSRIIVTGAGTLLEGDRFALSEKAVAMRGRMRRWPTPSARVIFDNSNLLKASMTATVHLLLNRRTQTLKGLFDPKQLLQLGLSDSNRCQVAEFLKTGMVLLVLDMVQAGRLNDAPQLKDSVGALQSIARDPALKVGVPLKDGTRVSALNLQRYYLEKSREYLSETRGAPEEYHEVVRLWAEVLDALERDPGELVGRVDWVSKRYLLETSGKGLSQAARKKIDIAYHELGSGYYDRLEREGVAPIMVSFEEIEEAMSEPPSPESARLRSRVIKSVEYSGQRTTISWRSAEIGSGRNKRKLFFDSE